MIKMVKMINNKMFNLKNNPCHNSQITKINKVMKKNKRKIMNKVCKKTNKIKMKLKIIIKMIVLIY